MANLVTKRSSVSKKFFDPWDTMQLWFAEDVEDWFIRIFASLQKLDDFKGLGSSH